MFQSYMKLKEFFLYKYIVQPNIVTLTLLVLKAMSTTIHRCGCPKDVLLIHSHIVIKNKSTQLMES